MINPLFKLLAPHQEVWRGFKRWRRLSCLSVCLSPMVHKWGWDENYQTKQRENVGQCWDHESRSVAAVLWRHHKSKMADSG